MKSAIKRRPFGATELMVSEVALGAMNLRMLGTEKEAYEMVNYVLDRGVNLIDTARAYNGVNGEGKTVQSEEIVGNVIRSRTDIDEPIVIVTKGHGYTPEEFDTDLDTSLRTLGVEKRENGLFIGDNEIKLVYFLHGIKYDRWTGIRESGALEQAKKRQEAGDFTYFGFSAHYGDGDVIREAIDTGLFQVIELPYNVYNRVLAEDGPVDLFKYAYDRGIAIVNMKTFNGNGMVPTAKLIKDIVDISYRDMLRHNLGNPYVSTIDAGCRYPAEFAADEEASLEGPMPEEQRTALAAEAAKVAGLFNNICKECTHCMEKFECVAGIDIPSVLGEAARMTIARAVDKDTSAIKAAYDALPGVKADECLGCGACLEWCEYHLDIPALMAQAKDDFE